MQPAPVSAVDTSLQTPTEASAALGALTGVHNLLMSSSGGQVAMAATHAGAAARAARTAFVDDHASAPSQAAPAATDSSQAATVHCGRSQQPEQLGKKRDAPAPQRSAEVANCSYPQASQTTSAARPAAEAVQSPRQAPPPSASHVAALWQQHKARQQQQQHQKLREAHQKPQQQQQQQVRPNGSLQLYSVAQSAPSPAAAGTHQPAAGTIRISSPQLLSRQHSHEPHQVTGTTKRNQRPQAGRQSSDGAIAPHQNQPGSYRLPGSCNGSVHGGTADSVPALHRQLSSTPDGVANEVSVAPRTPDDGDARLRKHRRNASLPAERAQTGQHLAVAG